MIPLFISDSDFSISRERERERENIKVSVLFCLPIIFQRNRYDRLAGLWKRIFCDSSIKFSRKYLKQSISLIRRPSENIARTKSSVVVKLKALVPFYLFDFVLFNLFNQLFYVSFYTMMESNLEEKIRWAVDTSSSNLQLIRFTQQAKQSNAMQMAASQPALKCQVNEKKPRLTHSISC